MYFITASDLKRKYFICVCVCVSVSERPCVGWVYEWACVVCVCVDIDAFVTFHSYFFEQVRSPWTWSSLSWLGCWPMGFRILLFPLPPALTLWHVLLCPFVYILVVLFLTFLFFEHFMCVHNVFRSYSPPHVHSSVSLLQVIPTPLNFVFLLL